jgi:hypothetical protein
VAGTRLGSIDLNTGIVTPLPTSGAETALPWSDIAVFGNEGYALTLGSIIKLDPTTGVVTDFPNNALNNTKLSALEFTSSGELYGVGQVSTSAGSRAGFFKVDIANKTVNLVAEIPGSNGASSFNATEMVFDPASGRFFVSLVGDELVSVGLAGDSRFSGTMGFSGSRASPNALVLDNGILYGYSAISRVNEGRSSQYIINTTTAAVTLDKIVTVTGENDDTLVFGA